MLESKRLCTILPGIHHIIRSCTILPEPNCITKARIIKFNSKSTKLGLSPRMWINFRDLYKIRIVASLRHSQKKGFLWLSLLCIMHLMCNLIGKDDVQPRAAIYQVLWLQIVNIVCHNETIPSRKIFIFLQYGIKYRCPKK